MGKLETLPWLVLNRICEYLNDDDDEACTANQRGGDLRAFSLTSRHCCAATASQRFSQVRMTVTNVDDLVLVLERWVEVLDRDGGRYRYAQRLKVDLPGQDKVNDEWNKHRLVVPRTGHPQVIDIDPNDYALATSPSLYSIVVKVRGYESDGRLNYNGQAALSMAAGAAPNLRHLCLVPSNAGNSLALMQAIRLGMPPAPPDGLFSLKIQGGRLRSLFFATDSLGDIEAWAARADFSKLCRLVPWGWDPTWAGILVGLAARGELVSLRSLDLSEIRSDGTRTACQLLTALSQNSLESLSVDGHIDDALFHTILDQHGRSLRYLYFHPYENYDNDEYDGDWPPPCVVLTPARAAQLAEKCPNLEIAELQIDRTLGDARECAIYRELRRLPRLRRLSLTLWFVVHPNEDEWDATLDEQPMYHGEDIPRPYLSQAFANAAVDANLARAIFDRLTAPPGGSLERLRLLVRRKQGRYAPASDDDRFGDLLRWFARDWICERRKSGRDNTPVVEIRELEPSATVDAGKEWQSIGEGKRQFGGEEVFVKAFDDVWPQTTSRWWEDWKSVPLSPDVELEFARGGVEEWGRKEGG
ncbi:hypothetical protein NEMBOFW57_009543 [Staphylotrichum longicolle]|uniref:Uncharacterized protein n=1 Tax=Staphylotrichum longicolle TaxID=669026 RepID=A0AAD4HXV2_9PEZI|nr:hypothetical protein NEMBOFW57_009543 [Staphylotrichum longicolle]